MIRTTINGAVTIDGRKVYFEDIFADDVVFQFSGLGPLVLPGDDLLQGVEVEGEGQIRALGPMTIDDGLTLGGTTGFVNVEALTQNGGVFALDPAVDDAVVVRNLPGATWTLADGAGLTHAGAAQFVTLGLLQQTGASETSVVNVDFYGRGTVSAEGALRFTGDVTRLFGNVEGTGVIVADDAVLIGADVSVAIFLDQNTRVVAGSTLSGTSFRTTSLYLADCTLALSGGDLAIGPYVSGSGEIYCEGTALLTSDYSPIGSPLIPHWSSGVRVVNAGDLSTLGLFNVAGDPIGEAQFLNLSGAVWDGGPSSGFNALPGGAIFENEGTFIGGSTFEIPVVNNGLFETGDGYFVGSVFNKVYQDQRFDEAVTGSGTIDVSPGSVAFSASVSADQTLMFTEGDGGSSPTLVLDDVQEFAATIAAFDQNGATDDQIQADATTWTFHGYTPDAGGQSGSLIFSDGAAQTAVRLTGVYDAANFHANVANNVTTITYG